MPQNDCETIFIKIKKNLGQFIFFFTRSLRGYTIPTSVWWTEPIYTKVLTRYSCYKNKLTISK